MNRRDLLIGLGATIVSGPAALAGVEKADRILVVKSSRRLSLWRQNRLLGLYPVALGGNPVGPKRQQGDRKTPEGRYTIDGRNPNTPYYLALHISYPSARDLARAQAAHHDAGGNICIHGLPDGGQGVDPSSFSVDWTDGCIAVSDRAIEEIWARVDDGTPIEILG